MLKFQTEKADLQAAENCLFWFWKKLGGLSGFSVSVKTGLQSIFQSDNMDIG